MQHLTFAKQKERIAAQSVQDQLFRLHVKTALKKVFGTEDIARTYIKDFSRTARAITIAATNKVFAQELFLKKETLQTELGAEVIIM